MLKHIFAATEFEMAHAIEKYAFKLECTQPFKVYENGRCRLIISGIGLVNASLCYAWAAQNFDFENSFNIGAAGDVSGKFGMGEILNVGKVSCVEPYDNKVFCLAEDGISLTSSASPVVSQRARERASRLGDIVDMEAYAFACAAHLYNKTIHIIKLVTDFSPECDIHSNIEKLRHIIGEQDDFWSK